MTFETGSEWRWSGVSKIKPSHTVIGRLYYNAATITGANPSGIHYEELHYDNGRLTTFIGSMSCGHDSLRLDHPRETE
jgi:hypothetical protein